MFVKYGAVSLLTHIVVLIYRFGMKLLLSLLLALPLFGKQSERYYQEKFAREIGGQVEVVMKDGTRCDILTATHAIEVDFAKKWAEAIGQSLNYAMHTGKRPGVALIVLSPSDNKYIERVRKISAEYSLGLTIYPIDGGGASKSVPKGGEKEFWITSSGKTHNSSCRYYGTTKSGRYSDKPSGDSCKVCGGG
jgi:hypothetical protein